MRKLLIISLILSAFLVSCTHEQKIDNDFKNLYSQKISIPTKLLEKRYCSLFSDTLSSRKNIRIVIYISPSECTSCQINAAAKTEWHNIRKYEQIHFIYIVSCPKEELENTYCTFCNARIEGTVYFDTCNAFRKANPQIPDNELFHTFVINREGKVLMVGNPFQNEKMEALFKKVIANERRKQRQKKAA